MKRAKRSPLLFACLATLFLVGSLTACNEHVFQVVVPLKTRVVRNPKKIDIARAADILFVIDNSGSMKEEQQNLAAQSSSSGDASSPCNQGGFSDLLSYVESHPDLDQDEWDANHTNIYNNCGFIERLLLFKNKFHIGVVTSDMNDCDQPYGAGATRGSVPQRGCLQTGQANPNRTVLDSEIPAAQLPGMFSDIITNVNIYGSAYEKGLEATKHFLTPGHNVPAVGACDVQRDCAGDFDALWRDEEANVHGDMVETKLVVIFLTDEEDCSHGGAIDETVSGNTDLCYTEPGLLVDTGQYVSFLRGLKPRQELLAVGLIAGLYDSGAGMRPSGCKLSGGSPTDACDPAKGNSVATCTVCVDENPVCPCHPAMDCPGGTHYPATNCCQADPAVRYYNVATAMDKFEIDTLCSTSYKDTMTQIANLINEPTSVVLSEVPTDPSQVVVMIKGPRWNNEWTAVPYYNQGTNEPPTGGWYLVDENTRIKFYGDWVPEPGDEVLVEVEGQSA